MAGESPIWPLQFAWANRSTVRTTSEADQLFGTMQPSQPPLLAARTLRNAGAPPLLDRYEELLQRKRTDRSRDT